MHSDVNSKNRGSADPFSLTILGFLVISFVVGTMAVLNNRFDIRQRAQTYPDCTQGVSSCLGKYNGDSCTSGGSTGSCVLGGGVCTCNLPQSSPTYDCRSDFEGQCVPSNYTCNPGTTITQASGCSGSQKCVPKTSTCHLPTDTPPSCPTSCLNGCIITENNTTECLPFCHPQLSCPYGCNPTISGGVCKAGCPSKCSNGCAGGTQVCNAYCSISCAVGQECLGTSEGGTCHATTSGEQVVSPPQTEVPQTTQPVAEGSFRKEGAACYPCLENQVCEFATLAECQASQVAESCLQSYCTEANEECSTFGLEGNSNTCANGGQCCMNTIQGYDFIDGNCEPCRNKDNCLLLNIDICKLTAQSRKRPLNGSHCTVDGNDGNTYYYQPGDTYEYNVTTPSLGVMCKQQTCGGGKKYCLEHSITDADVVLMQLNSKQSTEMITAAVNLSADFKTYGTEFKYLDPPEAQSLEITQHTLSALPPHLYSGMTLMFFSSQRSTNDGFSELAGKTAYIAVSCNGNENCSVNAATIIQELTHLHQYEEFNSSNCEPENENCTLLTAYNSAREKDSVCVGNQADSGEG